MIKQFLEDFILAPMSVDAHQPGGVAANILV